MDFYLDAPDPRRARGAEAQATPLTEARALTVTEFTRRVKAVLESELPSCWVRGEVSNLRLQASGHAYFSLKDGGAQLRAVLFRGDAARHDASALREGAQVVVFGQVSIYEARGEYQLIVRAVVADGVGRLQREFDALKARLAAEGLFARERKRALPALPQVVGFVTSPTGAAAQDFCRILARRGWRGRVVILPAKVQGVGAAEECAAQLRAAAALGIFDLLVVGRGGGSLEDLWAFNEEALVRAVVASPVPVVSAVGHEIDFTLCDFAADVRAETPSAAAELISSAFVAAGERAARLAQALRTPVIETLRRAHERGAHAGARLRLLTPSAQIERWYLRLDDLRNRLGAVSAARFQARLARLAAAEAALAAVSPQWQVERASQRLLGLYKRLVSVSPASVLGRGFALVCDDQGRPLSAVAQARAAATWQVRFADGEVRARPVDPA
jgi:exodeoxyribonuclease VII large subunit